MPTPYVRPEDVKTLTKCPACGSKALAPSESKAYRVADRVMGVATLDPTAVLPRFVGKHCLDCGWMVE